AEMQETILSKRLRLFIIDGYRVAQDAGLGRALNTPMQSCFFALTSILTAPEPREATSASIRKTYGRKSETLVERNVAAVRAALDHLHEIPTQGLAITSPPRRSAVPRTAS